MAGKTGKLTSVLQLPETKVPGKQAVAKAACANRAGFKGRHPHDDPRGCHTTPGPRGDPLRGLGLREAPYLCNVPADPAVVPAGFAATIRW